MALPGGRSRRITSTGRLFTKPPSKCNAPSSMTGERMPGMAALERTLLHRFPCRQVVSVFRFRLQLTQKNGI